MALLKPPFTAATAQQKVKLAQAMWNTQDPVQISHGYTPTSIWRNRTTFLQGTPSIISFLTQKWAREHNYTLRKELFTYSSHKIAVQFWYEYRDAADRFRWKRCYGLEDWTFDEEGKMRKRMMSGNDLVLGRDGDGVAVPEEGIMGRWFTEGVDVEAVVIGEEHF